MQVVQIDQHENTIQYKSYNSMFDGGLVPHITMS